MVDACTLSLTASWLAMAASIPVPTARTVTESRWAEGTQDFPTWVLKVAGDPSITSVTAALPVHRGWKVSCTRPTWARALSVRTWYESWVTCPFGAVHRADVVITPVRRSIDCRQSVVRPLERANVLPPSEKASVDQVGRLARCWTPPEGWA